MPPSDLDIGSLLSLHCVLPNSDTAVPISAKISCTFAPFTLSAVLKVTLSSHLRPGTLPDEKPSEFILKLYDRRVMNDHREERKDTICHTIHKEREYRKYIASIACGDTEPIDFDDIGAVSRKHMTNGQFEAYLAHHSQAMFKNELATYQRLHDLQGTRIPQLYGVVTYHPLPLVDEDGSEVILGDIPGLLLEYIPSVTLRTFVHDLSSAEHSTLSAVLPPVCNDAVALINQVSDRSILNTDVRLENILVRKRINCEENPYPCVLIDLAQCRLRCEEETNMEWKEAKHSQDEEGAVGYVLAHVIKKVIRKSVWEYQPSGRYWIFVDG